MTRPGPITAITICRALIFSLNVDGTAPQGSITSVIDSSIVAGQNRKQKVMQFHQYEHGSTLSTSNETEGIEFKGVHKFTGNSYDGPDMPSTWETNTNTTNSTGNQTVNQTVNLTEAL